ncbi:MAG: hypothetical protein AAGF09_05710 [Pseudomonadota bacterium]
MKQRRKTQSGRADSNINVAAKDLCRVTPDRQSSRPQPTLRQGSLRQGSLRHSLLVSCCALALGLAGAPETSAQTVWEGDAPDPDGTNWFVGENWNTATVPGVGAATNVVVVFDDDGVPKKPINDGSEQL